MRIFKIISLTFSTVAAIGIVSIAVASNDIPKTSSNVLGAISIPTTRQLPSQTFGDILVNIPIVPVKKSETSQPQILAESAVIIDLESATPLFEKNSHIPQYPASTTKIATALVALSTYSNSDILTVPSDIYQQSQGSSADLVPGDQLSAHDLIRLLLIGSANDAAYTLAINHPNGYDTFVSKMNDLAHATHLSNTSFSNPIGYDSQNNISTAYDLSILTVFALKEPEFRGIVSMPTFTASSTLIPQKTYSVTSTNELLTTVKGVTGVKTGWTPLANGLLITSIERNGHEVIIVVANSRERETDTRLLIDWVYNNYTWE
ncbi:D-alanyl-D-alanine carboxypeptidase [bacterium]|nr:D-alanyl-D-alanine carboxypeptidase [bacterium]